MDKSEHDMVPRGWTSDGSLNQMRVPGLTLRTFVLIKLAPGAIGEEFTEWKIGLGRVVERSARIGLAMTKYLE